MKAKPKQLATGLVASTIVLIIAFMVIGASPRWSGASPLAPTANEAEPNDNPANANPIIVSDLMFGDIETTSDVDYFVLTTTVGLNYQVTLTPRENQARQIDIYNSGLTRIDGGQTGTSASLSFNFAAQDTVYYLRISIGSGIPTGAGPPNYDYQLQVDYTATPTPTSTNTPTVTPTSTPTPLPPPPNIPIETEPNDNVGTANDFATPGKVVGAITSTYDVDCFVITTTIGLQYRLILQDYEFNRWLKVYDSNGYYTSLGNTTATNHEVELTLRATASRYFLCVSRVTTASPSNTLVDYLLEVMILQPTPTPTNTPTPTPTLAPTSTSPTITPKPTWPSGFDAYEPNYDFSIATTLAPGLTYNLNFMPWGGADVDNDFFKIRVKPGLQLTCETSQLDPGVDPRMAFYSGPSEIYYIVANDDIALGNFNSRLSYYITYEGYVYILLGQGERMDTRDTDDSSYSLTCDLTVPGSAATPAPDKDELPTPRPTVTPHATATPQTTTSPIATPTPPPDKDKTLDFRLITTPAPTTPTPSPTGFRTFRVLVYYDANADAQPGAGEGVPGFFVSVLSPENKEELARGYTDDQGQLSFTVPTVGTVQVRIPLLGFDRLIEASKPEVNVRIAPPNLPISIP